MRDELLIAVLAAGASRRLGQPKQLVAVDGEPLIRRQVRVAIESGIGNVCVICGHVAMTCVAQINDLAVLVRRNEDWAEGVASSLRQATKVAIEQEALALLILHCDQWRVTSQDLQKLHEEWTKRGTSIAYRSRHADYVGPPVILPGTLYDQLMRLRGDEGARSVLSSLDANTVVDVNLPNAVYDLDLPIQLEAMVPEVDTMALPS